MNWVHREIAFPHVHRFTESVEVRVSVFRNTRGGGKNATFGRKQMGTELFQVAFILAAFQEAAGNPIFYNFIEILTM